MKPQEGLLLALGIATASSVTWAAMNAIARSFQGRSRRRYLRYLEAEAGMTREEFMNDAHTALCMSGLVRTEADWRRFLLYMEIAFRQRAHDGGR